MSVRCLVQESITGVRSGGAAVFSGVGVCVFPENVALEPRRGGVQDRLASLQRRSILGRAAENADLLKAILQPTSR